MRIHPATFRSRENQLAVCLALLLLLMLGLLAKVGLSANIGPDSFGYRATSATTFSFVNIASTGALVLAGSDEDTATLNIGFPFSFYGTSYTSLCASTNGLISFGGCNGDFANVDLTAAAPSGNRPSIAIFWDDLTFVQPGSDGVYYQTLGASGNRQFVVQWNNALGLNGTNPVTFQVILNEGSNDILLQYLDSDAGNALVDKGAGATVGLRDVNGHQNGRRLQWSFDAPVLVANLAIRFIAALQVSIDIKPGDTNSVNPDKKGSIPVAVLTTSAFDARTVQASSVRFGRTGTEAAATQSSIADVDRDGDLDLILHFRSEDTGIRCGDKAALLTGKTKAGLAVKGSDVITTVSCK